jgi:hypothetical protein
VAAPSSAPIACANRNLADSKPGRAIRATVRLGDETATLSGTSRGQWYAPGHVLLRHGYVHLSGEGRPTLYRVADAGSFTPGQVATVIGSRVDHGYLCLVRFHPSEPAVALIGVRPAFMGGGPVLVFLAPGRRPQIVPGGFAPWAINTAIGPPVVATGDMRFFGIGGSDADSGEPLRVFTADDGRLVNVSRDYPDHIERDAAKWWQLFSHPRNGPYFGAIASWVADECSLGRQAFAFDTLNRLKRVGRFVHHEDAPRRAGPAFVGFLERFLVKTGYAT